MIDYRDFNPGDQFRIQLLHIEGRMKYPESIYCIFKSCKYIENTDILEELIVDQIIDIAKMTRGEDYKTVERIISRDDLSQRVGLYRNMGE